MKKLNYSWILGLAILFNLGACSEDDATPDAGSTSLCTDSSQIILTESGGLLVAEVESALISEGWVLRNDIADFTGSAFLVWDGGSQNNNPGNGLLTYKLQITNPGTYQLSIRSYIALGDNNTEHNDVWVRFPDADDFFGQKNNSIVYPKGSGKTPVPNGSGKEGWFKSYMNQLDQWSWRTSTSDHDAHRIFATFNNAGTYTLELSGRSPGFAIDRVVLFQESMTSEDAAQESSQAESMSSCQ